MLSGDRVYRALAVQRRLGAEMVFKREDPLKAITEGLGWIVSTCELQGLLKLFDNHILAQHFFCRLLNAIYRLQLQMMDHVQSNFPAIDLGDPTNRIAYQITTDKRGEKVQHTLAKFVEHNLATSYDTLRILVIGERQTAYKSVTVPAPLQFDCDRDILGVPELVNYIGTLPSSHLEEVAAIMNEELLTARSVAQQMPTPDLLPEAEEIMVAACSSEGSNIGKIVLSFDSAGWILTCANKSKRIPHQDRPGQARCKAALEQLLERKLIDDSRVRSGPGGNLIGWYNLRHAGYLAVDELIQRRAAAVKAGSVNLSGDMSAGSGKEGPGGHIIAEGGTGRHGASGGDVNAGPGTYKAGDGGQGPGGNIIIKGGDAE